VAVKPYPIDEILDKVDSIYEAIIIVAKRARQIHDDLRLEYNQRLETLKALTALPESEDETEGPANPDQLKLSIEFEKRPKPVELALDELRAGKISYRYKENINPFAKDTQGGS